MANITEVKVWKKYSGEVKNNDIRVYVHTSDGREGCKYLTGNGWHPAGMVEGKLTEAEWQAAKDIALTDGKWHTWYAPRETAKPAEKNEPTPQIKTNKHADTCSRCGGDVPTGQGEIWLVTEANTDEEDLDFIYHGRTGWYCQHLDKTICDRNLTAEKEKESAFKAKEQARKNEAAELSKRVATQTGMKQQMDWSFDDFGYHVGSVILESEHYTARIYTSTRGPDLAAGETEKVLGFVIKEKKLK